MIHAYASIWRCLMHGIIIEIREKACVHIHHLELSTQEWKWKQLSAIIQRIYESDFFFRGQFIFYSLLIEPCYLLSILSQIKKRVSFFKTKPDY